MFLDEEEKELRIDRAYKDLRKSGIVELRKLLNQDVDLSNMIFIDEISQCNKIKLLNWLRRKGYVEGVTAPDGNFEVTKWKTPYTYIYLEPEILYDFDIIEKIMISKDVAIEYFKELQNTAKKTTDMF